MTNREKLRTKKVIILITVVLGVCLLIGAGVWFYCKTARETRAAQEAKAAQDALAAQSALDADLARITAEDVIFVSMSYTDTPSFGFYGTEDAEQMKDAVGWIRNAGFHATLSAASHGVPSAAGGIDPCYAFTLRDRSKLQLSYLGSNQVEYNGWIFSVDDTELAAKFRALYDSVKDKAQKYPSYFPTEPEKAPLAMN